MFNKDKFLLQLKELIDIDCGTYDVEGVSKIANILEGYFKDVNFTTKQIKVSDKVGPLLIATNKPNVDYYDVVIIGHMDTVYKKGMVAKYPMRVEGNNVHGLGSIDMKSGLLIAFHTFYDLDKEVLDNLSLCFLCNPDEEISSVYSESFMESYIKRAKCALVMESAGFPDAIVNKRKGISRFTAKFKGLSAHASVPSEGASAIEEMSHFVLRLAEITNKELDTTMNVGKVNGGTACNVVSDYAELEFEIRYFDMDSQKSMIEKINSFIANPITKGVSIELIQDSFKPPMNNGSESQWLENIILESAKESGQKLDVISSGGGSDGNFSSYLGVPTIDGLGPLGMGWHNPDLEVLYLDSIQPKIDVLNKVLMKLNSRK